MPFSDAELKRYARHFALPEFGLEAQQKLKTAKVLVVGAGGLGSPLLLYLAAAGIGSIGIVDFDVIDESNLQRQVLFSQSDIGMLKTETAKARLEALNPHSAIQLYNTRLSADNALDIIRNYDVVVDGTDNFPTRYLVNDACVLLDKPNVFAAIYQFEGQVSVFNYRDKSGNTGPNYRDLYPIPPTPGSIPTCAEGGVLGVLPGIIGSMQASEVIKVITGIGAPLSGRLFHFDALHFESRTFGLKRRDDNPLNGSNPTIAQLIDYEDFCGLKPLSAIKEVTAQALQKWQTSGEKVHLVDVREAEEYDACNIGAELIPLSSVLTHAARFRKKGKVVVHCQSGVRSAAAIRLIEAQFGYKNLYSLSGGIVSYLNCLENNT